MIEARDFIEPARELGFTAWAGVPCSYLKPFINYVIGDDGLRYISSANEGDAVATATGFSLAGGRAVAMMQNSGLGNAVSPLTSLNWVFRVPVLLIITLRGDPDGDGDEPQHELMGRITGRLLDTMDIPWTWFPDSADAIEPALRTAVARMDATGRPCALVMRKGSVAPHPLAEEHRPAADHQLRAVHDAGDGARPSRREALERLVDATPVADSVVIGSTGYTGRELYAIADRPNHLYMVGSMGCAPSLALGLSLARTDLTVAVADGDGAALMRMGNLATVGAYAGDRFRHLLLDNGLHESTGGQATVSDGVRFADLAAGCGYGWARSSRDAGTVRALLDAGEGPGLLHLRIAPGTPGDLPRPSVSPAQVRQRLMQHIGADAPWATVT